MTVTRALVTLVILLSSFFLGLAFFGLFKSGDSNLTNDQREKWKSVSKYMTIGFFIFGLIVTMIAEFL